MVTRHLLTRHLLTRNFRYDICSLDICSPTDICSPDICSPDNLTGDICSPRNDNCSPDICSPDICSPYMRHLLTRHLLTLYATFAHPYMRHLLTRHLLTPKCDICSPLYATCLYLWTRMRGIGHLDAHCYLTSCLCQKGLGVGLGVCVMKCCFTRIVSIWIVYRGTMKIYMLRSPKPAFLKVILQDGVCINFLMRNIDEWRKE